MNKQEYLKSFLKENQQRIPRKLKKLYLKNFHEGSFVPMMSLTQFLNVYKPSNNIYNEIKKKWEG